MTDSFWAAVGTVVLPICMFLFPGIFFVPFTTVRDVLSSFSKAMLWSIGIYIATSFLLAFLNFPIGLTFIIVAGICVFSAVSQRKTLIAHPTRWIILGCITILCMGYAAFAAPFLQKLDGLPTGDSQKAIYWGTYVLQNSSLPAYQTAIEQLNRDPGDFFTPGLHTFIAAGMSVSPYPLTTVGLLAILFGIAIAWITATITTEIFDDSPHVIAPLLASFFVLTHFRFLRYLREPGYHLQNIVGEFLLFGLLLIGLRLIRRFSWSEAALALVLGFSLVVSHQFSVFVGLFLLAPLAVAYLFAHRSRNMMISAAAVLTALLLAAIPFGLYAKIPHLFTFDTHLADLAPSILDYPLTMGPTWFLLGMSGLLLLGLHLRKYGTPGRWAFFAGATLLLILSQGPRIFLDIPPVRALFYSVVPLSVMAAYFLTHVLHKGLENVHRVPRFVLRSALIIAVIAASTSSVARAYASSSKSAAPNSTATPVQLYLSDFLSLHGGEGVLIDDYNRRSSSWLILSGKPMYTRITADIERQMNESKQSELRRSLYLNQLDYEKIYALASSPAITQLLESHGISNIVGISNKSALGFAANPALHEIAHGDDIVLYEPISTAQPFPSDPLTPWLLRTSTLVNDIGDAEDEFQHLQASVRASRLSGPQQEGTTTFRLSSAPVLPLQFNVGDYVKVLWDQEQTKTPDIKAEFLIRTVAGPQTLTLKTPTGSTYSVTPGTLVAIAAKDLPLDDKGLVTLTIENSDENLIGIDLIALGLGRTP